LAEYVSDGSGGSVLLTGTTTYTGPISLRFTADISGSAIIYLDEIVFGSAQPARKMPAIYLPMVMKDYSPPPPPSDCPVTSTRSYHTIPLEGGPIDHPDYLHGGLNLSLRGWKSVSVNLNLVDISGAHDSNAPQIARMFNPDSKPDFTATYQIYDWNWSCGEHGCRGNMLTQWDATLLGLKTAAGQEISIPGRGPTLYQGQYQAVVLYAEEKRITLSYLRADTDATGYTVHIEDVCVDPNLLELYRRQVQADGYRKPGYQLPAISNNQVIGTALGNEVKVAIRDTGSFMDPRSRLDWWQAY
jgi:hypothetical protein